MEVKGIHYCYVGMNWVVKTKEQIINDLKKIRELGANAIKINGYDETVINIGIEAKKQGLKVWFHPQKIEVGNKKLLTEDQYKKLLQSFLNKEFYDVLGIGNELSLEIADLYPVGKTYNEKRKNWTKFIKSYNKNPEKLNEYLNDLKKICGEKIVYFAGQWETNNIDWKNFEIITPNLFYQEREKEKYIKTIKKLKKYGKKIVIGEFGFTTVQNAFEIGSNGLAVESSKKTKYEGTQAKLLIKNLRKMEELGVNGGFIHDWEEHTDLGFGIVNKDGTPKKAYSAIKTYWKQVNQKA